MKSILVLAALLGATAASAFPEGTIRCKNQPGLPDNVYTLRTVNLGSGALLPYLDITKHFRTSDPAQVQVTNIRGIAMVSTMSPDNEILVMGGIRLEFHKGELFGCQK